MNKQELIKLAGNYVTNSADNRITDRDALSEAVIGMKFFEEPILGFAAAEDEYFKTLQGQGVIGKHFILPKEWLPQSKTVISFFLPFTEAVTKGNLRDLAWPSEEWLHARIEGQAFINKFSQYLSSELISHGYASIVPAQNERFFSRSGQGRSVQQTVTNDEITPSFTSNWSERHVAFICGLGTFGLSKGLITSKGMAGRFGSIITELELSPDKREYEEIYEYCTMCGVCVNNCPVNAISLDKGKNHKLCSDFLDKTAEKFEPRYGCGKCQVGVPCETLIP